MFTLLLFIGLPFASVQPFWQWFWVCYIGCATLLVVMQKRYMIGIIEGRKILPYIGAALVFSGWGFLQAVVTRFGWYSATENVQSTIAVATFFLAHSCWFLLIFLFSQQRKNALLTIKVIAIIIAAYAVYGITEFYSGNDNILWYTKTAYTNSLTSTFVNRNSFAAYSGIGIQCALAWIFYKLEKSGGGRHAFINDLSASIWPLILILLCATALMLTGSRGGFLSVVVGLIFSVSYFIVYIAGTEKITKIRGISLKVILTFVFFSIFLFALSGDQLFTRWMNLSIMESDRIAALPSLLKAIGDRPLAGYGLGTFGDVFPQYRTEALGVIFDRAHNDFLELFMTAGIPLSLFLIGTLIALASRLHRSLHTSTGNRSLTIMGPAVLLQLGVHSLVDFSLQIPAISYTFVAILAVSVSSWLKKDRSWN